ncbi:transposase family protein [Rhizobium leguminosarum]|uniref:transposase family protein n=1 Tax=Rhizobium leguminosarum TaxID=384 RepID=UPI001C95DBEB|nr:transposase family protein [Rhizobium leguminosarum]MBY5827676.1 hypothetical protein [Rhizobium leguminosarum]
MLSRAGATASCPAWRRISRTVRSRYCRQVADLPLSGRRVRLRVRTRRFTCDAVLCGRHIFAERFGDAADEAVVGGRLAVAFGDSVPGVLRQSNQEG